MKFFVKINLLLLFCFITISSFAQDEEYIHPELEWYTIETEHFLIHFHKGAERTAKVVAKIAEEIYEPITSLYEHKPDQKVNIIIKDYDDFSNGVTYFYDNRIEIWASALDFELRGVHNWLRDVVTHEFTHNIQMQVAMKFGRRIPAVYFQWLGYEKENRPDVLYGFPNVIVSHPIAGINVPAWFAEGTAQFNHPDLNYDYWDTHRDMILRMQVVDNKLLSWDDLNYFGKTSLGNESVYNSGFSLVEFIAKNYGVDKLKEISTNLKSPLRLTIDQAVKKSLGIDGVELYNLWKEHIKEKYRNQIEAIGEKVEGRIIISEGFANFYPKFSASGKIVAYVSNKGSDYFSPSAIYIYNLETGKEEKLISGVSSSIAWSSDGKKIFYSKKTRRNKNWRSLYDIFVYDFELKKEKRLTYGFRANNPAVSPDGRTIAFVLYSDGTANIGIAKIDEPAKVKMLTEFKNGEQIYNLCFSPDGKKILFDYSLKNNRDIGIIDIETLEFKPIIATRSDERNPTFSENGMKIYFSSDRSGIFNIYEFDVLTGETYQVTNVIGGAFMPSVRDGKLVYSIYTSDGFKIAYFQKIERIKPLKDVNLLAYENNLGEISQISNSNEYDDTILPEFEIKEYKNVYTSLSFYPVFRFDNYNRHEKGIDHLKFGLYTYSTDVVGKYSFFAGALVNRKLERDLFLQLEFNDKFPILYQLGLKPKFSVEAYNVTRRTKFILELGLNLIPVDVIYHLTEVDLSFSWKIFLPSLNLRSGFTFSRYSAEIKSFVIPETKAHVPSSDDVYFIGRVFYLDFLFKSIKPRVNADINPVGRKINLRLNYELNKLNPDGTYEFKDGILVPVYKRFNFLRFEVGWNEYLSLPFKNHTLGLVVRYGTILGRPVNEFFNFYGGGLIGMRGYSFYSLGGNEIFTAKLVYRFPIVDNFSYQILHLGFQRVYAGVFFDFGNAWDERARLKDFKRDAGIELRIDGNSFYLFPMKIFASVAYGFDKFDKTISKVKYNFGREVRFYFGVVFDFDSIE
ncbi:MAG: BamA/TamA family outer membrane protein [Candidatus Kryptonium sp.]|nr:BamA/TamA family outer membrane protein [Candidatus Kryptonium sp.]